MRIPIAPSHWHVRLNSGALAHIWALVYSEEGGDYLFESLAEDVSPEEQADLQMTGKVSPDSTTGMITVARLPTPTVHDIHTATAANCCP
ncbi:hypothetical protein ABZ135_16825 [Streptomyces sp. NPDC006339]|uniref:hypothetical protein n=1 Tax=Streptomyces sp. NPDC006339 TaxID=3156755 RepID=UPI0033AF51B0